MTPQLFAKTIASIEQNYGLRLDARSAWLRMDAVQCGRGWVGTKPGCKRGGKAKAEPAVLTPKIKTPQPEVVPDNPGGTIIKARTRAKKATDPKVEPKAQQITHQKSTSEAVKGGRGTNGKHDDLPASTKGQVSTIQKLTGASEDEAKASIKAIKAYVDLEGKGVVSYGAIRNVQRGIFDAADGKPHYGNPLTKAEIAKVQSSIESIDQYVKKMPAFEGMIHRGMTFKSEDARKSFLSKISKGYSLEAMSSFSSSKKIAEDFAGTSSNGIIFTVKNKSGASIKQLSKIKEEEEVLVPKDTKYRIVGKPKKVGGVVVVQMEEF